MGARSGTSPRSLIKRQYPQADCWQDRKGKYVLILEEFGPVYQRAATSALCWKLAAKRLKLLNTSK